MRRGEPFAGGPSSGEDNPTLVKSRGLAADALEPDAHHAVRNASTLVAQRALDLFRAIAFAALVPRLLGPEDFGRFALLNSTALWFAALSGLGSVQLMGRFVPVMVLQDERDAPRRLLGNLLALGTVNGIASAAVYLFLGVQYLRDLPLALLAPMAATVALSSVARVPFAYFLGLNQAARWGAGELARRWSSLALILAGTFALGVRGACLGLVVAEVCVLALGLRWARCHVSVADVRIDAEFIAPYLRYSLVFFGSNLLFALCLRGGEALVRATEGDYAEVGYFGVAAGVWAVAANGVWALLMAFFPLLTRLRAQDRFPEAGQWAGRLLKSLTALGVVATFGAALLGADLLPRLVGPAFRPAVPLLLPISIALLAHVAGGVGRLLALALDRPRLALVAAVAQAAVLLGLGLPLASRFGPRGVAWAMVAASAVHAAVYLPLMQRQAALRLGPWLGVLTLGALFAPLALLPVEGLLPRTILFLSFVAGYAAALRGSRLVTMEELSALRRVLTPEMARR
jgi:O-antigen/teichoic acid export membrane protein